MNCNKKEDYDDIYFDNNIGQDDLHIFIELFNW